MMVKLGRGRLQQKGEYATWANRDCVLVTRELKKSRVAIVCVPYQSD
jgi:hypothetical protein